MRAKQKGLRSIRRVGDCINAVSRLVARGIVQTGRAVRNIQQFPFGKALDDGRQNQPTCLTFEPLFAKESPVGFAKLFIGIDGDPGKQCALFVVEPPQSFVHAV